MILLGNIANGQLKLLEHLGHDAVLGIPHVVEDLVPWGSPLNGKIAIMGNFNNIEMLNWNSIKTQLEVKKAINKAADGYGYVLSS